MAEQIKEAYNKRNTSRAVKDIMKVVDQVNNYIQEKKPWEIVRQIGSIAIEEKIFLHSTLSISIRCFGKISILLKPILPYTCSKIERDLFNRVEPFSWKNIYKYEEEKIKNIGHLIKRMKEEDANSLVKVSK